MQSQDKILGTKATTQSSVDFCYTLYMTKPQTVDEYIASFPDNQQRQLKKLRQVITTTLPDTTEALKWGSPAVVDTDGMILIIFSGHKHHINLVGTPSTREALQNKFANYETGKGSVKLAYDKPLPTELIEQFVQYRAKEYRSHGVKWM